MIAGPLSFRVILRPGGALLIVFAALLPCSLTKSLARFAVRVELGE